MNRANGWQARLERGEIVLLDGAMGTELQRRGVPMDSAAWSGAAVLRNPELVQAAHEDYIRAGADVIIANTFATSRHLLEAAGLGDRVAEVVTRAVELARAARERVADREVAVAGSMSAMPPREDRSAYPEPERELANFREQAGLLAAAEVDLIALEMMQEDQHAPRAMRAALETGLPVWLGVSCRRRPDRDGLVAFNFPHVDFTVPLDAMIPEGPAVVNVMHSPIDAVPLALEAVCERFPGPIGVYPESGYFTMPNWSFVDVISPEQLVAEAHSWVAAGARLIGGCCGMGPDHIRALRDALPDFQASIPWKGDP